MKIYSRILTETDVKNALSSCQSANLIGPDVEFERFRLFTSQDSARPNGFEVILATSNSSTFRPADSPVHDYGYGKDALRKIGRRYFRRGATYGGSLSYSPSWHEFGFFIATLLNMDPNAKVGMYDGLDDFDYTVNLWNYPCHTSAYHTKSTGRVFNFSDHIN